MLQKYPRGLGAILFAVAALPVTAHATAVGTQIPAGTQVSVLNDPSSKVGVINLPASGTTLSLTTIKLAVPIIPPAATRPTYSCASGATSCAMYMPLYDQTNTAIGTYWLPNGGGGSVLCGPTSASMALAGQIYYGGTVNPPKVGTWTANTFAPLPWYQRVGVMASLVGCSPTGGTMLYPWINWAGEANGVANRTGDFKNGGSGGTSFTPTDIQGGDLESLVRARTAGVMAYGHYTRKVSNILGVDWITFSRNGGHFIVASGFSRNDGNPNNDTIVWNDPWGGVNDYYRVRQIAAGLHWTEHHFLGIPYWTLDSVTIVPVVGTQAGYVLNSGTYYGIAEGHTDLGIY